MEVCPARHTKLGEGEDWSEWVWVNAQPSALSRSLLTEVEAARGAAAAGGGAGADGGVGSRAAEGGRRSAGLKVPGSSRSMVSLKRW